METSMIDPTAMPLYAHTGLKPAWQYRRVRALKIAAIDDPSITPAEDGFSPFEAPVGYLETVWPQPGASVGELPKVGGYYAVLGDGRHAYLSAAYFEQTFVPAPADPVQP